MMNKTPTEEQKSAIESQENIVLTAVPGSGKTYTIVEKIKYIRDNESDNDFKGIIGISYTNKASNNLKRKVEIKTQIKDYDFFGTIDSFFLKEIIYPFSKHYFKEIKEISIHRINDYFDQDTEKEKMDIDEILHHFKDGIMFIENLGDLAYYLLTDIPQVSKYLKAKYSYIMIDEYQDCGQSQHDVFNYIVKELGIKGFAVGDKNQSIFKDPKYINLLVEDNFFINQELTLNFRSNEGIVHYSNRLKNPDYDVNEDFERSVYYIFTKTHDKNSNPTDITDKLNEFVSSIMERYQVDVEKEIVLLSRTHFTCQLLASKLKIPYKYHARFKLIFESSKTLTQFHVFLKTYYEYTSKKTTLLEIKNEYFSKAVNLNSYEQAEISNILDYLYNLEIYDLKSCKTEFSKLFNVIDMEITDEDFNFFINEILSDKEELLKYVPAEDNEIQIMTMHNSKGLEFEIVILFDMYEYITPYGYFNVPQEEKAFRESQDFNLFYVAVTRAMQRCFIMIPEKRINSSYEINPCKQSKFLIKNNCNNLASIRQWNI